MLLKTILNHRYPLKGFVYGNAQISLNRILVVRSGFWPGEDGGMTGVFRDVGIAIFRQTGEVKMVIERSHGGMVMRI